MKLLFFSKTTHSTYRIIPYYRASRAARLVTTYISVRRRDLSVRPSVCHQRSPSRRFSFRFASLTPTWIRRLQQSGIHCPRGIPDSHGFRVWDSVPGIPDSRRFRVWDSLPGDPWIPSLGFIAWDPLLGSQTPVDSESGPWIPSLGFIACWDPLGSQTPVDSESGIPLQFNSSQAVATAVELSLFTSIKISTTKLQNTRVKLAEPFRLQIQFWKLIQFFSWLICTDLLLVQSIWLSNEAYIHFCWCVA